MSTKEILKRYLLFVCSLFFMGFGISLTKHGNLGISPISSVANVISCRYEFLSFGTWLFLSNCLFLLGQILLLRKEFKLLQLLQLPLSVIFGYFTDLGLWLAGFIPNDTYVMQLLLVFLGMAVLGFGIALSVIADVILNSAEAFVKALSYVTKKEFGNMKILVDVLWVTLSLIISLILFGSLVGVREGTIISAFGVGLFVKFYIKYIKKPIEKAYIKR